MKPIATGCALEAGLFTFIKTLWLGNEEFFMRDFTLSVVAPMYNEAEIIPTFINRLTQVLNQHYSNYEIILVDDGSTDRSLEIAAQLANKDPRIRVLGFSRNYGHEIALTAGIEHARGDWVVQMDSDLQHPPELIPDLVNKALEGFDIVYAARKNRAHESWLKKTLAYWFYKIARKMTGFQLPSDSGNFRVINHNVVKSVKQLKETNRQLFMIYAFIGFKTSSIPYNVEERLFGKSRYNYTKLFGLAVDAIVSFSDRPLRYMSILSVFISIILFCYAGFIVIQRLFSQHHLPDGMASLIFIMTGLFSVLFLFLAVISEYIGRILTESKHRPLYYIREHYGTGLPARE